MRPLSSSYVSSANGNIRNVNVTIKDINDSVMYTASQILSVSIQKSITDGSVGIGFTQADRLYLQVISDRKIPQKTWLRVYISIDGSSDVPFGRFVTEECVRDGSAITITAFDAMYYQSAKTVRFTGSASLHLEPLSFPCSMQDMLDYICALRNMTTEFVCQQFTVQKLPQKGENQYYSVRELIGFIAACHGCNAKLDASNHLVFKHFETVNYTASSADVLDLTIDDSEPYEVTGVLFTVDDETTIYIDDVEGSEYDEDDVGVISCFNPLATVEIAEYVWTQIGGLSYYGGSITQRGKGIIEVGDVITTGNLKYPADTETYPLCVTTIDYSISSTDGFIETIGSEAAKGNSQMPTGEKTSSGGGTGTGKWLDDDHTSVAHNDREHNTSQGMYDSVDGYDNQLTGTSTVSQTGYVSNGANTVSGQHNRLTNSTAMMSSGRRNTIGANSDSSVTTGVDNTFFKAVYSFASGNSFQSGIIWCSVALAENSSVLQSVMNSLVDLTGCYMLRIDRSVVVGENIKGSGNNAPAGDIEYSVVVTTNTAITNYIYGCSIFGRNHTIYSCYNDIVGGGGNELHSANNCAVVGYGNYVETDDCIVCGQYGTTVGNVDYYFVIGGGTSSSSRSNIFTVDTSGNVNAAGTITPGGADYAEYFEWLDGNPDSEDRRGMLVALDGDKITLANGDDILGVISGCASVIGNACDLYWHGKYAKDIYGRIITTPGGEPLISPDYDQNCEYIPRTQRPEWSPVGLVGRLVITDDGSCKPGGYVSARRGKGTSCYAPTNARVLRRIDETHVEVLIK